MRVAFVHPDLGLGGAERLVVDLATGLTDKGHDVTMFTSHYEASRSFEETRTGQFAVHVHGDWLPRHILSRCHILFAILRNLWLGFMVAVMYKKYDVIICDQVSASIVVLRALRPSTPVLFYCHFPDKLLASRQTWLKTLYRLPFDFWEEITTAWADRIVVNSRYTLSIVKQYFPILSLLHRSEAAVLYPAVNVDHYDGIQVADSESDNIVFLSINRFERKKRIDRALEGFSSLQQRLPASQRSRIKLIIAGGFDTRVQENVQCCEELMALAESLQLRAKVHTVGEPLQDGDVFFVRSFTDSEKLKLLEQSRAIVYTPSNEHFGIVPLECMAARRPVIAVASGGPLETVRHRETGLLVADPPTAEALGDAMETVVRDPDAAASMGEAGRTWVRSRFSRTAMAAEIDRHCRELAGAPRSSVYWLLLLTCLGIAVRAWYCLGK